MIVLDTSAVIAIALNEAEAGAFLTRIRQGGRSCLSASNYLEASLVLEGRRGAPGRTTFASVIEHLRAIGTDIVAFDLEMADHAREAYRRYGKGRHPAKLNFGDCFAYALAKALDAPLLYKGVDFGKTDIISA
ncbi:MAG: type II toxin-antitoxin system VapC family toxin [Hyphomonadaceae bacterium]|nr:type II toxin-antitoxin system VapC family toxin [Hyphomonadaceae bacterium]